MPSNISIDVYAPGTDLTAAAASVVTAKRFLKIAGNRSGGNVSVAHADAAGRVCGVARHDAATGELVAVARGNSRVVRVAAAAAITAGTEVEVGAAGQAVPRSAGVAVGYAVTGATAGADAEISLY